MKISGNFRVSWFLKNPQLFAGVDLKPKQHLNNTRAVNDFVMLRVKEEFQSKASNTLTTLQIFPLTSKLTLLTSKGS